MARKQQKQRLSEERLQECNTLLTACYETMEYLQQCKRCGMDMEGRIAEQQKQIDELEQVKREFFPRAK